MVSRRAFLAGTFASLAQGAFALPPEVSRIPLRRPEGFELRTLPSAAELIARADLGGAVSCVVADANTGEVLEAVSPLLGLPPASVTKAIRLMPRSWRIFAENCAFSNVERESSSSQIDSSGIPSLRSDSAIAAAILFPPLTRIGRDNPCR